MRTAEDDAQLIAILLHALRVHLAVVDRAPGRECGAAALAIARAAVAKAEGRET